MLKYLEKKVYVITKITISKETVKTSKIASLYYHHRRHRNQLATKKHRNVIFLAIYFSSSTCSAYFTMPKEKSSPIDLLMKKRATSSCIFPPGDLTPTGLKNVCCLSSRYRRYCRSNHRLFTSSSLPMSEVVFFIVIVPYRCNRRGYCSFDVVIIVVRIYTVNNVLILGDRQCSLSSFSLL